MSVKLNFPPGLNYIPQMDFEVALTENAGWEGSQTFLAKKSSLVLGNTIVSTFTQGRSISTIDPNCPVAYSFLTLKLFVVSDHSPGIAKISCTFSGYSKQGTNGSSGEATILPSYSLRKDIEEVPLNEHKKWNNLSDESKKRLGILLAGGVWYFMDDSTWGGTGQGGDLDDAAVSAWPAPTGDELKFARLIAQDKVTCKRPAWTYTVRTEGSNGFTGAQLNKAGKIVDNPQGNPPTPSSSYCWFFVGPDQEQSGDKRFVKDLTYQLIPDTDETRFLYD